MGIFDTLQYYKKSLDGFIAVHVSLHNFILRYGVIRLCRVILFYRVILLYGAVAQLGER